MGCTTNIANTNNILVSDVVQIIEDILQHKALFNLIDCGTAFDRIDIIEIMPIIKQLNIEFDTNEYYMNAICKMIHSTL